MDDEVYSDVSLKKVRSCRSPAPCMFTGPHRMNNGRPEFLNDRKPTVSLELSLEVSLELSLEVSLEFSLEIRYKSLVDEDKC